MGFYGNITNTSKTTFSFDVIYANRYEMESKCATDGVFLGRYVLVEYETEMSKDTFKQVYMSANGRFYLTNEFSTSTRIRHSYTTTDTSVATNEIVRVEPTGFNAGNKAIQLWKCIGSDSDGFALFTQLVESATPYTQNYNIDNARYGEGRGFDSTVWVKTTVQINDVPVIKYVQIAELNSVVPTFDIDADAPTQVPIAPHFDTSSTNVYYKVHWQPQWGFRVKRADDEERSDENIVQQKQEYNKYGNVDNVSTLYLKKQEVMEWRENPETHRQEQFPTGTFEYVWVSVDPTQEAVPNVAGNIFYNARGFEPYLRHEDYGTNEIKISTAPSGMLYNTHNGYGKAEADDTYELSIMLPAIGNAISKMWDIVYNAPINGTARNMDIDWNSTNGVRMIHPDTIFNTETGESYTANTFDVVSARSLAGSINSVHDLMGMIVESERPGSADAASTEKIYYNKLDGKFYIKYPKYNYHYLAGLEPDPSTGKIIYPEDLDFTQFIQRYQPVDLTQFEPDKYYYLSSNNYYLDNNITPSAGNKYFTVEAQPTLLSDNYEANTYHYMLTTQADIKRLMDEQAERDRQADDLYSRNVISFEERNQMIEQSQKQFEREYDALNHNFYCDTHDTPARGRAYYSLMPTLATSDTIAFYQKDTYFYKDTSIIDENPDNEEEDDEETYLLATEDELITENRIYYRIVQEGFKTELQWNENTNRWEEVQVPNNVKYEVRLINFEKNKYYTWDPMTDNYYLLTQVPTIPTGSNTYIRSYTLEIEEKNNFYQGNTYYYKYNDSSYLLDTSLYSTPGRDYYIVEATPVPDIFYEDAKYYYLNDISNRYVMDYADTMTEDRQYYIRNSIYVAHDSAAIFTDGAEWNESATSVPDTVALATRETYYGWKELEGFGRDLNTIHGLIIKINDMLKMDDPYTRDLQTVQGSINALKDIFNNFEALKPGNFLVADEYGRVSNSDWDTLQDFDAKNEQTSHKDDDLAEPDSQWLLMTMSTNANGPHIKLTHEFHPQDSTETIADKNIVRYSEDNFAKGNNDIADDTLELYTPIVDSTGHVVGKNIEKVTLPFGFKTLTLENSDVTTAWAQDDSTASTGESTENIVADNSKDTLNIKGGNKWIRFQTDALTGENTDGTTSADGANILTIAHETHTIITDDKDTSDINSNGDNLTIQDIEFDAAGHVTKNQKHTYTLPYGFKTITTNGRGNSEAENATSTPTTTNVVADNTQDTLAINSGNKWVRIDANAAGDSLTISHDIHAIDVEAANDSDINGNGDTLTIQDITIDAAGHVTKNKPHTYTLPYGFKTIVTNGRGNSTAENATSSPSTTNIVADTTQDSLAINSGNKWIRIDADALNDSLTITHDIHTPTTTDKTATDLNNNTDTLTIQDIVFDEAGHMTANQKHTYTLPYGYKTITTTNSEATTDAPSSSENNLVANTTQDTLNINASNKWIVTDSAATDTLKIGHKLSGVTSGSYGQSASKTVAELDADNKFSIPYFTVDGAGHITSASTKDIIIPENYKSIAVGAASNATDNAASGLAGTCEADALEDTLTLYPGNKWITIAANRAATNAATDDAITFGHSLTGATKGDYGDKTAQSPNFGSTFKSVNISIDEAGHVTGIGEHTVAIPKPSLTTGTASSNNASVLVGLSLTDTTGAFTKTSANVGTLLLTGYTAGSTGTLTASDTINTAFSKLQNQISTLNTSVGGDADTSLMSRITSLEEYTSGDNDSLNSRLSSLEDKSLVETSTKFSYTYNGATSQKTIAELMTYIAGLEKRIYDLEHPTEE